MMRWPVQQLRRLHRDDSGAVVVDFIPVFAAMILLVLVIFEIGIAYFLSIRSYKAAQLGARVAVVLPAIHSGVPLTNQRVNALGRFGEPCFNPAGADRCTVPTGSPWVCDGNALAAECNQAAFAQVVKEMRRTFPNLQDRAVTIRYFYRRLGETGGPFVPEVNVSIQGHRYTLTLLGLDGLVRRSGQGRVYGGVSASAFGENTSGLSVPEETLTETNS